METILRALFIFGFLQLLVAGVWFVIIAFREGPGHGLLMLFFTGIYAIIFSILHWEEAKKPFFTGLIGGILMFGSALLQPMLAAGNAFPDNPEAATAQAASSEFKRKLAAAIASQIAANVKRGSPQASVPSSAHPAAGPTPILKPAPVQTADSQTVSNAPAPKKSLLAMVTRESAAPAAKPASTNAWDEARAMLRVSGFMKTGDQVFANVNQKTVTVGDDVYVKLNGHTYRFKVSRIDLRTKTVKFDPIEP